MFFERAGEGTLGAGGVTVLGPAHVHLGSPAAVTAGFQPALWACVVFASSPH